VDARPRVRRSPLSGWTVLAFPDRFGGMSTALRSTVRSAVAVAAVGAVTLVFVAVLAVNPTTVALSYLVVILKEPFGLAITQVGPLAENPVSASADSVPSAAVRFWIKPVPSFSSAVAMTR